MREGMLALDTQGWVASLNPAAQAILGVPAKRALGRPIQDLLPAYADRVGDLYAVGSGGSMANLVPASRPSAKAF